MCCVGGRQEAQKQYLERDLSEGLLCAVINNNTRCYNESTEFADHLDDALAAPYKVRHKGLDICRCNASEALFKIQARSEDPAAQPGFFAAERGRVSVRMASFNVSGAAPIQNEQTIGSMGKAARNSFRSDLSGNVANAIPLIPASDGFCQ